MSSLLLQPADHVVLPTELRWEERYPLRGRALRLLLLSELMVRPSMTVAEMVAALEWHGYPVPGRTSKRISDGLRQEVGRSRVTRLGRGRYAYHPTTSVTTERRIRLFRQRCQSWMAAHRAGTTPPAVPRERRPDGGRRPYDPAAPPWTYLGWLWTS